MCLHPHLVVPLRRVLRAPRPLLRDQHHGRAARRDQGLGRADRRWRRLHLLLPHLAAALLQLRAGQELHGAAQVRLRGAQERLQDRSEYS